MDTPKLTLTQLDAMETADLIVLRKAVTMVINMHGDAPKKKPKKK